MRAHQEGSIKNIRDAFDERGRLRRDALRDAIQWAQGEADGEGPNADLAAALLRVRDDLKTMANGSQSSVREVIDAFLDDGALAMAVVVLWTRFGRAESVVRNHHQRLETIETQGAALAARVRALEQARANKPS